MIAVVQRVSEAKVVVDGATVGEIGQGLLVLAAIHHDDTTADLEWMARKLVSLRIFRNAEKHFDLDIQQINGALLLVSNFTVAAQTTKGRRPSLDSAAAPEIASNIFDQFVSLVRSAA